MKRLVLILSLFGAVICSASATEYIPLVREGVKWVYYDYQRINYDKQGEMPEAANFPIVYEFKCDEENPDSEFMVLWEDYTYLDYSTGEVKREIKPIAKACDVYSELPYLPYFGHSVIAKRIGSFEPLAGRYLRSDDDGAVYEIYNFFPFISLHFDRARLTTDEREKMFTFTEQGVVEMEDGSERLCWNSTNQGFKLIYGIGFVPIKPRNENLNVLNFIDLCNKKKMSDRILSHVIENGEIIYKSPNYDIIQSHVYNPEQFNANTGVEDVDAVPPTTATKSDETYYDMQGRAVKQPTEVGIYIRDGKKIFVK